MFSINEDLVTLKNHNQNNYNHQDLITSFVTGSSKLLVPGRVTASSRIPQGAESSPIDPDHLLGSPDVVQISAKINPFGNLDLDATCRDSWFCGDKNSTHWVRALRLSDDCHSYNIQLRFQPSQRGGGFNYSSKLNPTPQLILQVVRPIETGQELLLWFSEDILAMLQIAFLAPPNIQGQKKYVCTRCSALYESPNPLKLHISLLCGKNSISSLWEKLANLIRENKTLKDDIFDFKLLSTSTGAASIENSNSRKIIIKNGTPMDLSLTSSGTAVKNESDEGSVKYRPYDSAFKPFVRNRTSQIQEFGAGSWYFGSEVQYYHRATNVAASTENEAQIETLVSNFGKSKQGHICLYCGKCYSRKYGLKIHIRTHTGYKPLKCKYCMRPFGDPSNLNKHVRLHAEGNTPYKCDLCGKILVRRRDLDRHLKSRHMIETHPDLGIIGAHQSRDTEENCDETLSDD